MMGCPRATNFPVLRANVPPLFSPRTLEVSASLALGELEQLLQRQTVCIGRIQSIRHEIKHLNSSIYLSETDRGVFCPISVLVAIHVRV